LRRRNDKFAQVLSVSPARGARSRSRGAPISFKQWGAFAPVLEVQGDTDQDLRHLLSDPAVHRVDHGASIAFMRRVGKKAAGRLLDGREWNEMPVAPEARDQEPPQAAERELVS
jgi:hypothetical protein